MFTIFQESFTAKFLLIQFIG